MSEFDNPNLIDVPSDERAAAEPTFSASFKDVLAQFTVKASEGGAPKSIRRRKVTIVIDHTTCEPDSFPEPFKLTLQGLSSAVEEAALKTAGEGVSLGFALAKAGLVAFNGRPLQAHERDILWDMLGFGGRMQAVNAFMSYCAGVDEAKLGKPLKAEIG